MELSDLYSQSIIEIAANFPHCPRIKDADASARKVSRVCGSSVEVDLVMEDGRITAYGHDVSACALGQTSSAIMANNIIGVTAPELRKVHEQMLKMLKSDGPPPDGERWADLKFLQPVRSYPARHKSTLLIFEAVVDCLDQIEDSNLKSA